MGKLEVRYTSSWR